MRRAPVFTIIYFLIIAFAVAVFLLWVFVPGPSKKPAEVISSDLTKLNTGMAIGRVMQDVLLRKEGVVVVVGNHAFIPINKEGVASDFPERIQMVIRAFELSRNVEVCSKQIDSGGNQIYGIWLTFKPRDPKPQESGESRKHFYIGPIPSFDR